MYLLVLLVSSFVLLLVVDAETEADPDIDWWLLIEPWCCLLLEVDGSKQYTNSGVDKSLNKCLLKEENFQLEPKLMAFTAIVVNIKLVFNSCWWFKHSTLIYFKVAESLYSLR